MLKISWFWTALLSDSIELAVNSVCTVKCC